MQHGSGGLTASAVWNQVRLSVLILIAVACRLQAQEILHTSAPRVIHRVDPEYTEEALDAKLQGTVALSMVVGIDATPGEIKVVRGLGKGLDEKPSMPSSVAVRVDPQRRSQASSQPAKRRQSTT